MPGRARRTRAGREPRESPLRTIQPPITEAVPASLRFESRPRRETLAQAADLLSMPEGTTSLMTRARSLNAVQRALGNGYVAGRAGEAGPAAVEWMVGIDWLVGAEVPPDLEGLLAEGFPTREAPAVDSPERAAERTRPDALPEEALTEQPPERPQTSPADASTVVAAPVEEAAAQATAEAVNEVEAAAAEAEAQIAAEIQMTAPEEAAAGAAAEGEPPAGEAAAEAEAAAVEVEGEAATPEGEAAAREGAVDVPLLMPEPPTELSLAAQERVQQVQGAARGAARSQGTMPSADANVGDARGAITEPAEEAAGRAQGALVEALGEQPGPSPEIEQLCENIRRIIRSKRPPDEEQLVKADPGNLAQEAGGQLDQNVQGDTNRVSNSYNTLDQAPQGQPQQQGQGLEGVPGAAPGPEVNAASAVPDTVPAENVSLEADVQASQTRMDEAGMNSETAQLIETGPVAEAREAQGELQTTAERDPAEVLAEQEAALGQANQDMGALQEQALAALQRSRASTTTGVGGQRQEMVGTEEQMRAEAGRQAQAVFQQAQTDVENQLRDLPTRAMEQWNSGVNVLSEQFKAALRPVERWINERHEGGWGAVVSIWDDITGLPDWVTEEYDRAEMAFGDGVCNLIRQISTDVNTVVAACQAIIQNADAEISRIYESLPADLQGWAQEERARFQGQLNGLSQRVMETRDNFNRDLVQRASQAVDEVRTQIHALRQAARGLLGRVIDAVNAFLDDPIKFIIEGLLNLVGIPPANFWALVARIQQVISDIADDPLGFANNLLEAIGMGFSQFFNNIGSHLLQGLLDWLFSGLGSVGVEIPRDFSLPSIITFFLQIMGITWERIRRLLARHIGEENVALIEQAWQIISTLIEQGPEGIFEMIKEQLDPQNILDQVLQAAIDFLVEALIQAASVRILGLLNPAGAILQAIEAIYRVLKWIFENAARIFSLVETVVNGMADIIAGNLGGMATAVEGALVRLIAPVIDFLADYIGLGDLPDKIADVIRGMQEWVEGILDRVIGWLAEQGRRLLSALGLREEEPEEEEDQVGQVREDQPFTLSGANHTLTVTAGSAGISFIMASGRRLTLLRDIPAIRTRTQILQNQGGLPWTDAEFNMIYSILDNVEEKMEEVGEDWNNLQRGEYSRASDQQTFIEIKVGEVVQLLLSLSNIGIKELDDLITQLGRHNGPYQNLRDPEGWGPRKRFTPEQRTVIKSINKAGHGGNYKSDRKSKDPYGCNPIPEQEVDIDHMVPYEQGGSNSYSNAQLVSKAYNASKQDRWIDDGDDSC